MSRIQPWAEKFTDLTTNRIGEYVPAIPMPFYLRFGRCKCDCGKSFSSEKRYREHYALSHILNLE